MGTITLRNVPDDVYARWQKRARERGLSVTAYLRSEIIDLAKRPTDDELASLGRRRAKSTMKRKPPK